VLVNIAHIPKETSASLANLDAAGLKLEQLPSDNHLGASAAHAGELACDGSGQLLFTIRA